MKKWEGEGSRLRAVTEIDSKKSKRTLKLAPKRKTSYMPSQHSGQCPSGQEARTRVSAKEKKVHENVAWDAIKARGAALFQGQKQILGRFAS